MAADKDYSATPLAQKLGAKPGAGVVVFFTTSGADLESRFAALKETLDPADGLWIAWPKKAAKIDSDLTFEAVQEIGLAHGLVDNKSCAMERRGFERRGKMEARDDSDGEGQEGSRVRPRLADRRARGRLLPVADAPA